MISPPARSGSPGSTLMATADVRRSKFLSLVLRHQPETIGLALDINGWADITELLTKLAAHGQPLTREQLDALVADNDKQRFTFDKTGTRIRANQGHSLEVDLALAPVEPPEVLYHGTATRFLDSIRREGLKPGTRQSVHLSHGPETARKVGARHGTAAVLAVRALEMHHAGFAFTISVNGVWLVAAVPPEYIAFPPDA